MIQDPEYLARWERELSRSEPPDFERNLAIMESMMEEAVKLGVFPPKDPMEGIEAKIRMARILNGITTAGDDRDLA